MFLKMTVPKLQAKSLKNTLEGVQFLVTLLKANFNNLNKIVSYSCLYF